MNVLVTGANGFIGDHIVSLLIKQGHKVIACVRNIENYKRHHHSIEVIMCDFIQDTSIGDWLPRLTGIDVVINAAGIINETPNQTFDALHNKTPIALFKACQHAGIKRIIQISALGADETAVSQFHLSKKAADDYLMLLDLDWIIVMPSIVYGSGAKSMSFFTSLAALPITPIIDTGNQKIQPIHINDFSIAVSQLILPSTPARTKISFVGPTPITMREVFTILKRWLGIRKARFIKVPFNLALNAVWLNKLMPDNVITKESIQMLNTGNTADPNPFIRSFGFKPRSLADSLDDTPAQQSDKWHAKLLLLRPLLIMSIAFIWIYTGIISAFIYPIESSYTLLARIGITDLFAPIALYGAAALDFMLGIATFMRYRLKIIGIIQIAIIISYSLLITLFINEQWIHPFGPISKNIPLIVAILIMIALED